MLAFTIPSQQKSATFFFSLCSKIKEILIRSSNTKFHHLQITKKKTQFHKPILVYFSLVLFPFRVHNRDKLYLFVIFADEAATGMVDVQNCALFTFETLANTPNGVTSPTIVTFLAAKSMLNDVTPENRNFLNLSVNFYVEKKIGKLINGDDRQFT